MANLSLGDYTSVLKDILLPYVRDNFPKKTILLDQVKRDAGLHMMNDEFIFPLYTTRHGGIAALADDNNLVTKSGGRDTSRGTVAVKRLYAALDISKLTIDASRNNTLAVEGALEGQTKRLTADFARTVNRQLYSDGVGVVSMVRATGGSVGAGTIAVEAISASIDDARTVDWYGTINGDISPTKYFAPDQIIGVGTGGAADGTITSVTGTSIVSGAPTAIVTAANDSVYIQDGSGEGAGSSELVGIRAALSSTTGTSTYAGVARNVNGWTPAFGSASEALTLDRLTSSYISASEFADPEDKFIILVNATLYRRYGNVLTSMRQSVNEAELLGGWKGLSFAAGGKVAGVFLDFEVPDGEALVINLDSWALAQVSDAGWVEDGAPGSMLRLSDSIVYQAVMTWFVNAVCLAPAANGRQTRKTA